MKRPLEELQILPKLCWIVRHHNPRIMFAGMTSSVARYLDNRILVSPVSSRRSSRESLARV